MPEVLIYNIRDPSKNQKVEYDLGDETLESILNKYDENASNSTCRIAIGDEVFTSWDFPIEACLEYGDSISLFFYPTAADGFFVHVKTLEGNEFQISINPNSTIEELKREIEDRDKTLSEQQRIIFAGGQLKNERTLSDYFMKSGDTVHMIENYRGGGITFSNITEDGKILSLNSSAPEWRTIDWGLNLEGRCKSRSCKAFNKMVIMQMGTPIIYKLGFPHKKTTICPMCNEYVKPETCGFYECSFRFLGVMETNNGPQKYKSDWKEISGEEYHRFDEENKCNWISLVIETKSYYDQTSVTRGFSCSVCFSSNDKNLQGFANCEHKVHTQCAMLLKNQECLLCKINHKTI